MQAEWLVLFYTHHFKHTLSSFNKNQYIGLYKKNPLLNTLTSYILIYLKWLICSSLILCILPAANATHIVGGEMTYACLGNDRYEIQLVIYRDCFFGNPNAYFDDPASIGVFNQNNLLEFEILVPLMGDDTLSQVLTNECLVIPPTVCVHTTTYRVEIELPPVLGGYQLAYQRCCRNQTIANIIEPLATGATFGVTISEQALLECNSSATFTQWPPLYICANEPIFFDQSATDVDGDSIVYRLCTPLQGADQDNPIPQPPNNPPFQEVNWNDPPYSTENMLNGISGGQVLAIDSATGLLTGTPNTIGQFVVGICAEEYRNGVLISTTRRDFQYNVGVCGQVTAAFFAPEIQCNSLIVSFNNQSLGADNFQWVFSDEDLVLGTSTELNPTFTFPQTGVYEISLIADPGSFCADTFMQTIQLLPNSLSPEFSIDTLFCGDSLSIHLTDHSTDFLSTPIAWEWSIDGLVFSHEPDPNLIITEPGNHQIILEVTSENGCKNRTLINLNGHLFIDVELATDTVFICPGDSVFLNNNFNEIYDYEWSPSAFLDEPLAPNPLAFPEISTNFELIVRDSSTSCSVNRSIFVHVNETIVVDHTEDITTCADSILLAMTSNTGIRHSWSTDPDFIETVIQGLMYWVSPIGEQTYYLQVIDDIGCVFMDSVLVNSQAVNLELPVLDTAICLGDQLFLSVNSLDINDEISIEWQPNDLILSGQNTTQISVSTITIGEQYFSYQATNQFGCENADSIHLTIVDTIQSNALFSMQQCNGNRIQFTSGHPYAALYQWHFGDPNAPNVQATGAAVSHLYSQPGTYEVSLTLPEFLTCWDTFFLAVNIQEEAPINVDFSWEYLTCADTASIVLNDATQVSGTEIIGWEWYLSDILIGNSASTTFTAFPNEIQNIRLITAAENGCIDTLDQSFNIPLISFELENNLRICSNESVFLHPAASSDYEYSWSPSDFLDDAHSPNPLATPPNNITYTVTITDPNTICERTGQIAINVPTTIEYNLSPDTVFCDNNYLLFAESDQAISYQWAANNSFSPLLSEQAEWIATIQGNEQYFIKLTDTFGCTITDSVTVSSHGLNLFIDTLQTVCIGDTLQLVGQAIGGENLIYQWTPTAAIIGTNNTPDILVSPQEATNYHLFVINNFGCEIESTVQVNVFNFTPPLMVTPEIDTLFNQETIQLFATENQNYTYQWSPENGLSATDIFNPFARPQETTTYHLTIRDANGCINTAEVLLITFFSPCLRPYVFTPNAFTPNGDGLNDDWGVEGNTIATFHLSVYNRWGELVFESFNQNDKWDGTYNETALPADVYGYYLEIQCIDGVPFFEKGNVSLIR